MVTLEALHGEFGLPWEHFGQWAWANLRLGLAALAAAGMAAHWPSRAVRPSAAGRGRCGWSPLGYAVPGAVIAGKPAAALGLGAAALARQPDRHAADQHLNWAWSMPIWCASRRWRCSRSGAGYARLPGNLDETARPSGEWG